ncbi:hypothetical protein SGRIM128S_09442 [Streptomyces griseomycini]
MDHVGHRGRGQGDLLLGVHLHPLVLGDLADGAAQDVDQRDRFAPGAARPLAADDDQVLLVAAQLAGRGVQRVQAREDLGVGVPAFQLVELAELEVDQVLALPCDAQDDLLETAPGVGEFDRGAYGGALRGVERLGDLAQFVVAVVQHGRRRLRVDLLAALQPGHHVGQPLLGQAEGGQAQAAQPAGQRAGDAPGQADAQQQREQSAGAQGGGGQQQAAGLVGAAGEQRVGLLPDHGGVLRGDLVHGLLPPVLQVRHLDAAALARGPGREDLVLDRLQGAPLGTLQDPFGLCLGAALQGRHDLVLDQPAAGVDQLREVVPALRVEAPGGPGEGELCVLPGDQLRRVLQRDHRAGLRGQVPVVDLGELLEGVDLLVDDRGVLVERLLGGDVLRVVHLVPVVLQAAHRAEHRVQPVRDARRCLGDRVRLPDQLRHRLVGLPALCLEGGPGALRIGQPRGGQPPLPLQRQRGVRAHRAGRPAQFRLGTQPQSLREHLDRRHAPHGREGDAGHQGQEDQ